MPFEADSYRALGLAPGASLNEIRSAYRRLAKTYHPDAAGDRALPRFLAVQAAYERLVDAEGRLRGPVAGPAAGSAGRASREAWRARRGGDTGTGRPARPEGGGRRGGRRPAEETQRRSTRRATAGSTSYDEAAETPLDPAWDGGDWYGPNSGTYWTINPREYADPRKHGPEYLARARRAAGLAEDEPDDQVVDADRPDGPEAVPPMRGRFTTSATSARFTTSATSGRPAGPAAVSVSTAAIVVALPVAAVLALGALSGAGVGDTILIALLAVAWVVAFVAALVRLARSRKPPT